MGKLWLLSVGVSCASRCVCIRTGCVLGMFPSLSRSGRKYLAYGVSLFLLSGVSAVLIQRSKDHSPEPKEIWVIGTGH